MDWKWGTGKIDHQCWILATTIDKWQQMPHLPRVKPQLKHATKFAVQRPCGIAEDCFTRTFINNVVGVFQKLINICLCQKFIICMVITANFLQCLWQTSDFCMYVKQILHIWFIVSPCTKKISCWKDRMSFNLVEHKTA